MYETSEHWLVFRAQQWWRAAARATHVAVRVYGWPVLKASRFRRSILPVGRKHRFRHQLGRAPFRQARTTAKVATDASTAAVATRPAVRGDGRVVTASTVRCHTDGCGSSVIAV